MIKSENGKRFSDTWFSPGMDSAVKCPVEGCLHTSTNVITKAHLRIEHGMTREEVAEKYGYPEILDSKGFVHASKASKLYNSVANVTSL